MPQGKAIEVTDADFATEVLESDVPVLVAGFGSLGLTGWLLWRRPADADGPLTLRRLARHLGA